MKVNGEIVTLTEPVSLKDFLEKSGYTTGRIAVEQQWRYCSKKDL